MSVAFLFFEHIDFQTTTVYSIPISLQKNLHLPNNPKVMDKAQYIETISLEEKLKLFNDHWNPRILAELNGQHLKIARIKGEFTWHKHDSEDELFMVISGELKMELRDKTLYAKPNEIIVIPKGTEHRPVADTETVILLFEPVGTRNTGDVVNRMTKSKIGWI